MTPAVKSEIKHLVGSIQRFSVNDGPGIRTSVFLKGCPLKCAWCHNPENINTYQEFFHYEDKCTKCGSCAEACPENAIIPPRIRYKENPSESIRKGNGDGSIPTNLQKEHEIQEVPKAKEIQAIDPPRIDRDKCTRCMKCVDACEFDALKLTSTLKSVDEIFADVMKDDLFYESSGGGFTVSGGEPLMHPDMTMALLKRAKQEGLHTVLDTTGFANWNIIKSILEYVDLVLFDIKQLDDVKHKKWTGVSNRLILENAQKMAQSGIKMRLRLPIIHSVNFWDLQYPKDIVEFAKPLGKSIIGSKLINIDKGKCLNCFQCVDACDFNALIISGKFVTVDEVIKEIEKDIPFYEQSGGGLTISGGEPTAQPQFALELLKAAKERGINTALDTSGYQSWSILEEILDYTDYVLYDLKHLDRNQHIAFTGVPNDLILENLEKIILRDDVTTYIRMPLLPGVNDSEENIRATGEYVKSLGLKTLYLLPAHPFAGQSYRLVGIDYPFPIGESYPEEKANIAKEILESYGLDVKLWIAWVEDNVSDKSQLKESAKIQTGTV